MAATLNFRKSAAANSNADQLSKQDLARRAAAREQRMAHERILSFADTAKFKRVHNGRTVTSHMGLVHNGEVTAIKSLAKLADGADSVKFTTTKRYQSNTQTYSINYALNTYEAGYTAPDGTVHEAQDGMGMCVQLGHGDTKTNVFLKQLVDAAFEKRMSWKVSGQAPILGRPMGSDNKPLTDANGRLVSPFEYALDRIPTDLDEIGDLVITMPNGDESTVVELLEAELVVRQEKNPDLELIDCLSWAVAVDFAPNREARRDRNGNLQLVGDQPGFTMEQLLSKAGIAVGVRVSDQDVVYFGFVSVKNAVAQIFGAEVAEKLTIPQPIPLARQGGFVRRPRFVQQARPQVAAAAVAAGRNVPQVIDDEDLPF
jgi:hypothetical protein